MSRNLFYSVVLFVMMALIAWDTSAQPPVTPPKINKNIPKQQPQTPMTQSREISGIDFIATPHAQSVEFRNIDFIATPYAQSVEFRNIDFIATPYAQSVEFRNIDFVATPHAQSREISGIDFIGVKILDLQRK